MKLSAYLFFILLLSLPSLNIVEAYPFHNSDAYAYPQMGTLVDQGDGTGTLDVEYTFTNIFGADIDWISLEFESDVFDLTNFTSWAVGSVNPGDWTITSVTAGTNYKYKLASSGGSTISEGTSLDFTLNVDIFLADLTSSTDWDEGQIWAQSYTTFDVQGGSDGGSTALIPEPHTLLLSLLSITFLNIARWKKTS